MNVSSVDYYSEGCRLYKEGDFSNAKIYFESVINSRINNPKLKIECEHMIVECLNDMGNASFREGDYNAAKDFFIKALLRDPNNAVIHSNLAGVCRELNEYDKAIEHGKRAIELESDYAEHYNNLGDIHFDIEQFDDAIKCFKRAADLEPNNAEHCFKIGNTYDRLGNFEKAIEFLKEAIKRNGNNVKYYRNCALTFYTLGQYNHVIEYFEKAIKLDNGLEGGYYYWCGRICLKQQQLDLAKANFEKSKTDPIVGTISEAFIKFLENDFVESIKLCDKELETDPKLGSAFYLRAMCNRQLGHITKAKEDIDKAIVLTNAIPYKEESQIIETYLQGLDLHNKGNYPNAVNAFTRLITLEPQNPRYHNKLALTYMAMGEYNKAIANFNLAIGHAIEANLNASEYYLNCGIAYAELGKDESARVNFENVEKDKLDSENSGLYDACILYSQGKYKESIEAFKKLKKTHLLQGKACERANEYKNALIVYNEILISTPNHIPARKLMEAIKRNENVDIAALAGQFSMLYAHGIAIRVAQQSIDDEKEERKENEQEFSREITAVKKEIKKLNIKLDVQSYLIQGISSSMETLNIKVSQNRNAILTEQAARSKMYNELLQCIGNQCSAISSIEEQFSRREEALGIEISNLRSLAQNNSIAVSAVQWQMNNISSEIAKISNQKREMEIDRALINENPNMQLFYAHLQRNFTSLLIANFVIKSDMFERKTSNTATAIDLAGKTFNFIPGWDVLCSMISTAVNYANSKFEESKSFWMPNSTEASMVIEYVARKLCIRLWKEGYFSTRANTEKCINDFTKNVIRSIKDYEKKNPNKALDIEELEKYILDDVTARIKTSNLEFSKMAGGFSVELPRPVF